MKIILNKDKHRLLSHRFFLLLLLQSSHLFHKGVAGFIILPVVRQQVFFFLCQRRKLVMDGDFAVRGSFLYSAFNIALLMLLSTLLNSREVFLPKSKV